MREHVLRQDAHVGAPPSEKPGSPSLAELVRTLGLQTPTSEQAAIAEYPPFSEVDGVERGLPLLVVAGAGSGKTETLSLRATYIAAHYGIPGESILGLTFTRKAAGELSQRLRDRLQSWAEVCQDSGGAASASASLASRLDFSHVPEATTYNAFALGIVQEFGGAAGFDPQVSHMGEAAAWQLMSEVVASWREDLATEESEATVVERALGLRDAIANQAMTVEQARAGLIRLYGQFESARLEGKRSFTKSFYVPGQQTVSQRLELLKMIEVFDQRKQAMGQMDYADQVGAAIRIVEEFPAVREELRERHKVVFLDEFQDTSVAQMRFLASLFGDHPVTAVGDPNQAIYGWRGASAASLEEFHPRFNRGAVPEKTLTLSTAWRNDQAILRAANVLAAPLAKVPTYARTSRNSEGSKVVLPQLQPRSHAGVGSSQAVFTVMGGDALLRTVEFVKQSREKFSADDGHTPASVAVLSRTRAALQPVVTALRGAGVPAQIVGGDSLLGHPVIRDLRAALEISNDVGKSAQLLRLLTHLDLGAGDLRALGNYARVLSFRRGSPSGDLSQHSTPEAESQHSKDKRPVGRASEREASLLLDAVDACSQGIPIEGLSEVGTRRVARLGMRLRNLRSRSTMSLAEQIQEARSLLGFDQEAAADPTSEDVTAVLDVFADVALEYEAGAQRATMGAFLTWLDAVEKKERGLSAPSVNIDPNAVQVMTIHASKGLEWDAVALIDVATSRFPSTRGKGSTTSKGVTKPPQIPAPAMGWWQDAGVLPYPLRDDHAHLPDPQIWDMSRSGGAMAAEFKEEVGQYLQDEERRLAYVAVTRAKRALLLIGSWFGDGVTPRFPSVFMAELFAAANSDTGGNSGPAWRDFLDGNPHDFSVPSNSNGRRGKSAAVPALTIGELAPLPPGEEWESLTRRGASTVFPRDPGPVRRQGEQAAARVMEAFTSDDNQTASRSESLASLSDQLLAKTTGLLLAERDREEAWRKGIEQNLSGDGVLDRVASLRPLSVTEIAGFAVDPQVGARDMLRPVPAKPGQSALVGTLLHSWLERKLRRLSVAAANPDGEEDERGSGVLSPDENEFFSKLRESAETIDLTQYEVVAVEVPFTVTHRGRIVRGRIDAVLRDSSGDYMLIDWKTSSRKKTSLSAQERKRYGTQLGYYRQAWADRAEADNSSLTCALVFIYPGGTWWVSEAEIVGEDPTGL